MANGYYYNITELKYSDEADSSDSLVLISRVYPVLNVFLSSYRLPEYYNTKL